MLNEKAVKRIGEIDREILELKNKLESNSSDIGDYKVTKIYEYRMQNLEDPYNAEALFKERQIVRDAIGRLEAERAELEATNIPEK